MSGAAGRPSGCVVTFVIAWTLMMLGFTTVMSAETAKRYREFRTYRETKCTILATSLHKEHGSKGSTSYRIESVFEFSVEGRRQVATDRGESVQSRSKEEAEARVAQLAPGTAHPCWYDPADSTQAVLEHRLPRLLLFLPIPFCLALFGLVLLLHYWTHKPLGRFGGVVCGIAFSAPWLLIALGMAGPSLKEKVFAGIFGTVGVVGLAGTIWWVIRARVQTRP